MPTVLLNKLPHFLCQKDDCPVVNVPSKTCLWHIILLSLPAICTVHTLEDPPSVTKTWIQRQKKTLAHFIL